MSIHHPQSPSAESSGIERWSSVWTAAASQLRHRYATLSAGLVWLAVRPLLLAAVFTAVFGGLMGEAGSRQDYVIYLLAGLVPWIFFDEGVRAGARTFLSHAGLMKSQRTDPVQLCAVSALEHTAVFTAATAVLWAARTVIAGWSGPNILFFVPLVIVTFLLLWGLTLILSVLVVFARDLEQAIEPAFILLFWSAPVVYRPEILPEPLQHFARVWPPAAWVRLWRPVFDGREPFILTDFAIVPATALVLVTAGWLMARRRAQQLTDLV